MKTGAFFASDFSSASIQKVLRTFHVGGLKEFTPGGGCDISQGSGIVIGTGQVYIQGVFFLPTRLRPCRFESWNAAASAA